MAFIRGWRLLTLIYKQAKAPIRVRSLFGETLIIMS